jgi:hypothetical protein
MTRENGRDGEEAREPGQVSEERLGAGCNDASRKVENDWATSGTEDPAFFIKPHDGE